MTVCNTSEYLHLNSTPTNQAIANEPPASHTTVPHRQLTEGEKKKFVEANDTKHGFLD